MSLGMEMWKADVEAQLKSLKTSSKEQGSIEFLKNELKEIGKDMKEIKESMSFMNGQFEDWRKHLERCCAENKKIKDEMEMMKKEVILLQKELKVYRREKNENDQDKFKNELELTGVPNVTSDKVKGLVERYMEKLSCKVQMKDVKEYQYIPKREEGKGVIRMVLSTKDNRDLILQKAKKVKVTLSDLKLGGQGKGNIVYANERLSQYNKHLFYLAKKVKEESKWKFLWVKDGRILARKDVGQKVVNIVTESDLKEFQYQEKNSLIDTDV